MSVDQRWKFRLSDDYKLVAEPDIEKMADFINERTKALSKAICNEENILVLRGLTEETIRHLIYQCRDELTKRGLKP